MYQKDTIKLYTSYILQLQLRRQQRQQLKLVRIVHRRRSPLLAATAAKACTVSFLWRRWLTSCVIRDNFLPRLLVVVVVRHWPITRSVIRANQSHLSLSLSVCLPSSLCLKSTRRSNKRVIPSESPNANRCDTQKGTSNNSSAQPVD